jgi:hypothetical protein
MIFYMCAAGGAKKLEKGKEKDKALATAVIAVDCVVDDASPSCAASIGDRSIR